MYQATPTIQNQWTQKLNPGHLPEMDDVRISPASSLIQQRFLRLWSIKQQSVLFSTTLNFGPLQFKNEKYFSMDLLRIWKLLRLRICGIYSEIHAAPICGIYTTRKLDQTGQGGGQGVTKGLGLDLIRYSSMQIDSKLSSAKCFRPRS